MHHPKADIDRQYV